MALTQEELTSWIAWLRNESLKQAQGKLFNGMREDTYCCLGVLCEKVAGLKRMPRGEEGYFVPVELRYNQWLSAESRAEGSGWTHGLAPHGLMHQARQRTLSTFNDGDCSVGWHNGGTIERPPRTFAQIADFLEARGLDWANGGDYESGEGKRDAAFFDSAST